MKKMNNKLKEIDWKNHIYHIFDDTINIKNLKPNKIKMKRKFKNILYWIYYDQRL